MYDNIEKIYRKRLFSQAPILRDDDIQLQYILNCLSKNRNISILDAGCGNGNYAFYLSNLGYENISAIDLFEKIETDLFDYQQSSIDSLPFKKDSFDFIYANSVIYYLKNPENGILELKRVLKDDGVLFFTAHTKYSLFTFWRVFKRDVLRLRNMEHLQGVTFYSANYYKNILEKNGFEILLQDGYQVSFILYPFYEKLTKVFKRLFNMTLPWIKPYQNSNFLGKIKSEISYHSVFVVRKKNA